MFPDELQKITDIQIIDKSLCDLLSPPRGFGIDMMCIFSTTGEGTDVVMLTLLNNDT